MTPTLAMIVQREADIASFESETFYIPEIATGVLNASAERLAAPEDAEAVRASCDGQAATVISLERQQKTSQPPKLYDLTTLKREANRFFGFTAQQTLDYAQSLYEKKLLTYPRTDSRFITSDMRETAGSIANWLQINTHYAESSYTPNMERIIDDSKVTDHHALIPTLEYVAADLDELPSGERDLLNLVCVRALCATAPAHSYEAVTAVLDCAGHEFKASGKTVLHDGWRAVERAFLAELREKPSGEKEAAPLPELAVGQIFESAKASVKTGSTRPPRSHTEDTLLSAMENAGKEEKAERSGIGTPATRAGVIEKLVKSGFITRQKKLLIPTEKGSNLISVLPEVIKSPKLTSDWEHMLAQIERGGLSDLVFMEEIAGMLRNLLAEHTAPIAEYLPLFSSGGEAVGTCPRCGGSVRESKKGFFCGDRRCGFKIWKDNRFFSSKRKTVDADLVTALLNDGSIELSGLYSEKTGKTYSATVYMDPGEPGSKYVNFVLEFGRKDQEGK